MNKENKQTKDKNMLNNMYAFLMRTSLKGEEVPEFNKVMQFVESLMKESDKE